MRKTHHGESPAAGGRRSERTVDRIPTCRCGGACRCRELVSRMLLRRLERECEFYRQVM